jgi:hypothetical protein
MVVRATTHPNQKAPQGQTTNIPSEIGCLAGLPLNELRAAWRGEFRKDPAGGLSRDLLLRTLAWRLHEKAFGGHDRTTLKILDAHARGKGADSMFRRLKAGTVLVREYQGKRHTVTIAQDGFVWQEKTYSNLSMIARAITGTNWNGPRFFGLRQSRDKNKKAVAQT